jgi:hypothetical protein
MSGGGWLMRVGRRRPLHLSWQKKWGIRQTCRPDGDSAKRIFIAQVFSTYSMNNLRPEKGLRLACGSVPGFIAR